jgi:hypothetical protein
MPNKVTKPTPLFWTLASLIAFTAAIVTAVVLVRSPDSILSGLTTPFYYVVLIALGCAAALLLFGAMRGYAKWTGHALSGTLEISGAVAIAALTVAGGYFFRPEPTISLVVRVIGPRGRTELLCPTAVRLFLGQDPRQGDLGQNCQAQFNEVPARFLSTEGLYVQVTAPGFEQTDSKPVPISTDRVLWVAMRKVAEHSMVWGRLIYPGNGPVTDAVISIDGGLQHGKTNSTGQFRFEVPLPEGRVVQLTALAEGKVVFDEKVTLPIASTLTAREAQ